MVIYKLLYWSFFLWKGAKIMGRNLKGKELGEGIYQQANGTYCARFIDRFGKRKSKRSKSCKK